MMSRLYYGDESNVTIVFTWPMPVKIRHDAHFKKNLKLMTVNNNHGNRLEGESLEYTTS